MSRTYRRTKNNDTRWYNQHVHQEFVWSNGQIQVINHDTKSQYYREKKIEWHRDGWCNETGTNQAYKWHTNKWRRAFERNQLSKVYRESDYDDAHFDDQIDQLIKTISWYFY